MLHFLIEWFRDHLITIQMFSYANHYDQYLLNKSLECVVLSSYGSQVYFAIKCAAPAFTVRLLPIYGNGNVRTKRAVSRHCHNKGKVHPNVHLQTHKLTDATQRSSRKNAHSKFSLQP